MNKLIRELAEQADVLYTKHYDLGSVEVQCYLKIMVYFNSLLVYNVLID